MVDRRDLCDDPDCTRRHPWASWGESSPSDDRERRWPRWLRWLDPDRYIADADA